MIYVDRHAVPVPLILQPKNPRIEKELEYWEFYYEEALDTEGDKVERTEKHFDFSIYQNVELVLLLRTLFKDKCAYCETNIEGIGEKNANYLDTNHLSEYMDLDLFRPRHRAINLDNEITIDGYWWLAYEWTNIYLCCPTCYYNKGTRFPVKEKRARPFEDEAVLTKEVPYLLNPCSIDLKKGVEAHLYFEEDGTVKAKSKKGYITIEILGLNRPKLVQNREKAIATFLDIDKRLKDAFVQGKEAEARVLQRERGKMLEAEFTGAKKQILAQKNNRKNIKDKNEDRKFYQPTPFEKRRLQKITNKRITEIELTNFRNIKHLKLTIENQINITEPWLVLIGENGTGKSNILQAVAIALMGEKQIIQLGLKGSDYLSKREGVESGTIQLAFESGDIIEVIFEANKLSPKLYKNINMERELMEPYDTFCGFGATRLFSNKKKMSTKDRYNIEVLFDPYARPIDYIGWLEELAIREQNQSKKQGKSRNSINQNSQVFWDISNALKKLLLLDEDTKIFLQELENTNDYYLVLQRNSDAHPISLRHLSSGYQSVLFLFLGIVKSSFEKWNSPFVIDSIILIDEIGVHLHPEWKMRIVCQLRDIFVYATFIVSTHEPLCLRGLLENEVVLLVEDEDKQIIAHTDLPAPNTMRVGQLLTSIFGLGTTMDPVLSEAFEKYLELKIKPERNQEEEQAFRELKVKLETFLNKDGELNMLLGSDLYAKIYFKIKKQGYFAHKEELHPLKPYKKSTIEAFKRFLA